MPEDWFRKTTWTKDDEADFFARLARARKHNRGQYLYIQSRYLNGVGDPALTEVALSLLDLFFHDYPDAAESASAYQSKAECLVSLNRIDEALLAYREAMESMRAAPNFIAEAPIEFSLLVVKEKRSASYDEALSVIDEFGHEFMAFVRSRYEMDAIRAIIYDAKRDHAKAGEFASRALATAEITQSDFRYHRKVGLVDDKNTDLHRRLRKIVAGSLWSELTGGNS